MTTTGTDPTEPGRAWVFGDNVDTDQIIPSRFLVSEDLEILGEHVFEDHRPGFASTVESGDFVVGGHNFGSGSSREHAPLSLLGAGIDGIVAQSFARIFFRNGINLGLPVLVCPNADEIAERDRISLRLDAGVVVDHSNGEQYDANPLAPFIREIVDSCGLKPYTREKLHGTN